MESGIIIIEGNIGVGKSTYAEIFCEELSKFQESSTKPELIREPDEKTNPYLQDYNKDPKRYAFEMQMFLLTRRFRAQKYAQSLIRHKGGFVVMDRSYYGDVCFANVQRSMGYFSERDYQTYMAHHCDMKSMLEPPAVSIFLNATPEACKARISKRISEKEGRKCETTISIEYLQRLNDEIISLREKLEKSTKVFNDDWSKEKTEKDIKHSAWRRAGDILLIKQKYPDFWAGKDGIGA